MSDKLLIRHCAPTLAGMKTGNLFSCSIEQGSEVQKTLSALNRRLRSKGLRLLPIKYYPDRVLIYVYRPAHLQRDLHNTTARQILQDRGYRFENPQSCVVELVRRLRLSGDFPHEIGLFLGYPPEDVRGFIEKGASACKLSGIWKVYDNENRARALFAKYKKCTEIYARKWDEGNSVERLTVNG